MFCPNCGKELSNNVKFCKFCGTKILVTPKTKQVFSGTDSSVHDANNSSDRILQRIAFASRYRGVRNIGVPDSSGSLSFYEDRIEYKKKMGSGVGGAFGAAGMVVAAKKAGSRGLKVETYYLTDIGKCYYAKYGMIQPSIVLELKNGDVYMFACTQGSMLVNECIALVRTRLDSSEEETTGENEAATDWNSVFFGDRDEIDESYTFAMRVTAVNKIPQHGIAVSGSIKKGTVYPGMTLKVLGTDNTEKGAFEIKSIAVNKSVVPSASEEDKNAALLITSCPEGIIEAGDLLCAAGTD